MPILVSVLDTGGAFCRLETYPSLSKYLWAFIFLVGFATHPHIALNSQRDGRIGQQLHGFQHQLIDARAILVIYLSSFVSFVGRPDVPL